MIIPQKFIVKVDVLFTFKTSFEIFKYKYRTILLNTLIYFEINE